MGRSGRILGVAIAAAAASRAALAATLSLAGALDPGNAQDVAFRVFTLASPGNVTIQSYGYGGSAGAPGGANAAGVSIPGGGFDPYVSVFAGAGPSATFLASNDDGACPPGTVADGLCGDSTLALPALPAGTYTIAISAFLNMSLAENLGSGTLGDGFVGLGSYGTRTNAWAVDVGGPTFSPPALLLAFVPNGLTFGPQTVGATSGPLGVVVTNAGSGAVALGALAIGGPDAARFAAGGDCAGTLAPGASCTIAVTFTPDATGPFSASVTLASNAPGSPIAFAVGGTGTNVAVPTASLSAVGLDFGARYVGTGTGASIVVTNAGGATLVIGSVSKAGPQPGDFAVGTGCDGASLAPSATCTIDVEFHPAAAGARSALLTLPSNASNAPVTLGLDGLGIVRVPVAAAPVPALSAGGLSLLAALAALAAVAQLRRRRPVPIPHEEESR